MKINLKKAVEEHPVMLSIAAIIVIFILFKILGLAKP